MMRIWRRMKRADADAVTGTQAVEMSGAAMPDETGDTDHIAQNQTCDGRGWGWFDEGQADVDLPQVSKGTENAAAKGVFGGVSRQERDRAWQRILGDAAGHDGAVVCADLRAMTLERALGPGASPQAIWMLEGQRALVLHMLRRARGV